MITNETHLLPCSKKGQTWHIVLKSSNLCDVSCNFASDKKDKKETSLPM